MIPLETSGYVYDEGSRIWIRPDYAGISYNDGDEHENRLAGIVQQASDLSVFSIELAEKCTDWPSLYHLSSLRGNILRPFERYLKGRVLEIGAGCGAITRYLGEAGGEVLALEGSPRRASIAASRTRDLPNVTVLAERFDDFRCDEKFDAITLIGVLEYASMFSGGDDPACNMLARVRQLLKPEGRLFIAIENQLGLKYLAGAPEDHIGQVMYGIEGRYQSGQPHTYGRRALASLIARAGFTSTEFLAPFPDYKLPVSFVTEKGFNQAGFDASAFAWQSATRDPQLPTRTHFNLALAWPVIFDNELGLDVANSFLVVTSPDKQEFNSEGILAYHYSADRRREYCKETRFAADARHGVVVQYRRLADGPAAREDTVYRMVLNKEAAYVRGFPLSQEVIKLISSPGWTISQATTLIRRYLVLLQGLVGASDDFVAADSQIPGRFVDALPQNIVICPNGDAQLIDMEWEKSTPCEVGYLVFRALLWLPTSMGKEPPADDSDLSLAQFIARIMAGVGLPVTDFDLRRYYEMELEFQHLVTGRNARKFLNLNRPVTVSTSPERVALNASLYFAADDEPFSEAKAVHGALQIGRQVVRFRLDEKSGPVQKLRCDPVNGRHWIILHKLEILDSKDCVLWRLPEEQASVFLVGLTHVLDCTSGRLLLANTEDPQVLIPLRFSPAQQGELQLTLDIELVSDDQVAQHMALVTQDLASVRERLNDVSAELLSSGQTIAELNSVIAGIQGSTSWRVTRPLRQLRRCVQYLRNGYKPQGVWSMLARSEHLSSLSRKLARVWPTKFQVSLEPAHQIEPAAEPNTYLSTGSDPYFVVQARSGHSLPAGICHVRFRGAADEGMLMPDLYVDDGNGMREQLKFPLGSSAGEWTSRILRLPKRVVALRLDPTMAQGAFKLDGFEIVSTNTAWIALKLLGPKLIDGVRHPGTLARRFATLLRLLREQGVAGVRGHLLEQHQSSELDYEDWVAAYDYLTDSGRVKLARAAAELARKPLISVVMPVYNPPVALLNEAIYSVRNQIYPHWELCIADDASPNPEIRQLLKKHAAEDQRIKLALRDTNGHISEASNSALELAHGEYIALLDHDDLLAESALYWVANELNVAPDAALIYSDEDKVDLNGVRADPYFKCDWNYDLFLSHNMISHLGVYSAELIRSIGGFRTGFEGSQDYDLALRCIERISASQIRHIPRVLYHWRVLPGSTALAGSEKPYALLAGQNALNSHMQRMGVKAKVELVLNRGNYRVRYELPSVCPLVTLVIPTRNGLELVRQCVESILNLTHYPNYEILIIDNGSDDPEVLRYFASMDDEPRVKVLRDDRPFNYSALNNYAASVARGELIGLINNDIEVISPDWLDEMVSIAVQPTVGAVGARLWYPNDTLQHGGVIMGVGGIANHAHKGLRRGMQGYFGRAEMMQSFSAVTAACLLVRRELYQLAGGLNEEDLAVAFNDVDFCLRLGKAGYRNVWTPFAELYHHESATRGADDTPEKSARFIAESRYMETHWQAVMRHDPAYSPNLTLAREDFSLAWPPRVSI